MKLGFVTAILPDLSFEEVLRHAASLGYQCVEVMCWPPGKAERRYAGVTHLDVTDLSSDSVENVQRLCDETGVSISGLGYYPNPLSPDLQEAAAAVAHLREVIQAAPRFGVSQVNSFVGRDWTKTIDANWPRFLETWKPLVELAESVGVRIGIENCPMLFSDDEWPGGKNLAVSPAIWRRMFEDIPSSSFGLNYDPSHMVFQHMDYLQPMQEFSDRLFHIHAKDVRIDRQGLNDYGVLALPSRYHHPKLPGLGEVDWGKFCSVLGDTGYDGPVCVEVEDRVYEATTMTRVQSLQQSHDYLRNFIARPVK
ncbi:sugar phosphate isomerase/epimerase family protein [Neorhodopirellula pilleata]|uniref:Inosose dehydratase n=1 Tax=Neorhodopirellula pilleata TaxID=2714738 RepID=A0A5C6AQM0_9BACT|nr:sugar phosphate isomerase/epimerase family protein [Neorhodopirellula pilleata]TWU01366.1 Inosose dehydratase [Neorhodopirellula pilleata]